MNIPNDHTYKSTQAKHSATTSFLALAIGLGILTGGCSQNSAGPSPSTGGATAGAPKTGAVTATGGGLGTGGAPGTGGRATGGVPAEGGGKADAAITGTGGATGGVEATGGTQRQGGQGSTGGTPATGGTGGGTRPDAGVDSAGPIPSVDAAPSTDTKPGDASGPVAIGCATVQVNASGAYSVTFKNPAWTFSGNLGAAASEIATATGTDKLGSYCDTTFTYTSSGSRNGRIRAYAASPVVLFNESSAAQVSNIRNFPKLTTVPKLPYHITYGGGGGMDLDFINYTKVNFIGDSPFVYFNDDANTFILSGASHFPNTQTTVSGGPLTSGIQENIKTLPAGFETSTILVADPSFNRAYEHWGQALLAFTGKTLVPNDATPVLGKVGYWTDNGATYYYKTQAGADYQTTMKNVVAYYKNNGVPMQYMQLDSWWYPKGSNGSWSDSSGGFRTYEAHKELFPDGLAAFQQSLGIGLITHNRWLDANSPYRTQYSCSGNQVTDAAFWKDRAAYLKAAGVLVYEQDWLSRNGLPNQNNLTDQEAFLDNMAKAMGDAGIDIQYCMPLARHILQSTKYNAVTNSRVSSDRFASGNYMDFFFGSRLAWSVRLWPWTDVFMSSERDNVLLSNLSAGLFGVGDAINGANFTNLKKVVRPDGVIVKPDVPVLLIDRSVVEDAKNGSAALITSTYTQHTAGKYTYVYAFSGGTVSFTPAELGYSGKVYVYDAFGDSGKAQDSAQTYTASGTSGYFIVAPVGSSGVAFLGDKGKFVSMGKKRVSAVADDGGITATIQFATGEGPVTVHGYAAASPTITASAGSVSAVTYSASTQRFSVVVTAAGTSATIRIAP